MIRAKYMQKEKYYGNKEYKLELINIDKNKVNRLISQFKFRLFEGGGLAWYYIGYTDNGIPHGLIKEKFIETLNNIFKVINYLELDIRYALICKGLYGYCCVLKLKSLKKIDLIY